MSWAKLDDQFFMHPKVIDLSKDAKLLFLASLTYCAGQLTDGHITPGALRLIAASVDVDRSEAAALVAAGLWEVTEYGWTVHDYLEYQPTRERALATKQARAQAGSRGGSKSAESKAQAKSEQNAKQFAEQNGKQKSTPSPSPSPSPESSPLRSEEDPPARDKNHALPPKGASPRKSSPVYANPPTGQEVFDYCDSLGWGQLATEALDFQTARGWMYKSGPITDWKAALRTWKRNRDKWETEDRVRVNPPARNRNAPLGGGTLAEQAEEMRKMREANNGW